jgi:Haem-binding domain
MARRRRSWKRILLWVVVGLIVLFGLIQLVPYGRSDHTNPAAANPFKWTDAKAEAIAKQSCYDCHSNETKWWWATNIAPFSWLVQRDVDGGRERLNFSDWNGTPADEIQHAVDGNMPPIQYKLIHWSAGLSDSEKQTLVNGYKASMSSNTSNGTGFGEAAQDGNQNTGGTATPGTSASSSEALAVIDSQCASCHPAPTDYRAASSDEAAAMIDDMVNRGASVNAEQKQTLIDYFTQ